MGSATNGKWVLFFAVLGLAAFTKPVLAQAQDAHRSIETASSTALWEEYRQNPDRHPIIPNCSYAGYHYSERPLPEPPVVANVKDFGAIGDGKADDQLAFQAAIRKARSLGGGAILVPEGTYRLTGMLRLTHSHLVLRGAGVDRTVLQFERPLSEILGIRTIKQKPPGTTISEYSWLGGLIHVGVESDFDSNGGIDPKSGYPESWSVGYKLAILTSPAKRGDRIVEIEPMGKTRFKPGDFVFLCWESPADRSLLVCMAGDGPMARFPWETKGSSLLDERWNWPVEIVKSDGRHLWLRQPLRLDIRPEWKVSVRKMNASIEEVGIEHLAIKMRDHPVDPHLQEKGFNGIYLTKAINCWVRNVSLENVDDGMVLRAVKNCTITDFVIKGTRYHHHGTTAAHGSHDNLFTDFKILSPLRHGINTEGFSTGNVWRKGVLAHGTFDSHCLMPFEFIRTNLEVNNDGFPGGSSTFGPRNGMHVVHWNIRLAGKSRWINQPDDFSKSALVGIQGTPADMSPSDKTVNGDKGCVLADEDRIPSPTDLFQAQLDFRLR